MLLMYGNRRSHSFFKFLLTKKRGSDIINVRKVLLIKTNWIGNDGKNIIHSYEDWIVPVFYFYVIGGKMEIESLELKTEKEYKEFLDYLFSIRDLEYRDFNTKIVVPVDCEIIGIRTPILRDIAKKIAKTSSENFLNLFEKLFIKKKIKYYEEKVLYGFLIGYSKMEYQDRLKRINFFINIIDNWAVCDIVDSSFKFINKNKEDFYKYLNSKLSATNPWEQRFIFVMLLAYYVEDKYLKDIFKICEKIKSEEYYVNMAKAWLLSVCYVKYREETYKFLEKTKLDAWTVNKAIQKIRESLRVTKEEKEKILVLKRK